MVANNLLKNNIKLHKICYKHIYQIILTYIIPIFLSVFFSSHLFAQEDDNTAPLNIEADTLSHNDLIGYTTANGNVKVQKGSIYLSGETVTIEQDLLGYQSVNTKGTINTLAYFKKQRTSMGDSQSPEFIEGEAEEVIYNSKTDVVELRGQAMLRRLVKQEVNDQVRGDTIYYNNVTDSYRVQNANQTSPQTTPETVQDAEDRVRLTIQSRRSQ
jgi:lipopolysaccharide export system protein LptA